MHFLFFLFFASSSVTVDLSPSLFAEVGEAGGGGGGACNT